MIRVVVAEDQAAVRAGLVLILRSAPDVEVAGEAADGEQAVAAARALRPDVVLMDVQMPRLDGVAATAAITAERLADVLVLTTFDLDAYVFGALRAGAAGFLLKDTDAAGLLDAVRLVARGDGMLAPAMTRRLISEFARQGGPGGTGARGGTGGGPGGVGARGASARPGLPGGAPGTPGGRGNQGDPGEGPGGEGQGGEGLPAAVLALTPREREVLAALGAGLSNAQIAEALAMAEATTKTHVSRILAKLDLRSRTQAAVLAAELGWGRTS